MPASSKQEPSEFEPFWSIVDQAGRRKGKKADDHEPHPVHRVQRYVVRMCQQMVDAAIEMGAQDMTLERMLRLEATCTGTDYSSKLPMRAYRLVKPV